MTCKQNKDSKEPKKVTVLCADPNEETGIGKFIGVMTFVACVVGWPVFCRTYYPAFKQTTEAWGWSDSFMFGVASTTQQVFIHFIFGTAVYGSLYYLNIPFFERYKAFDEPWPWQSDPKKFRDLLFESIPLACFSLLVLSPSMAFSHYFINRDVDLDFSIHTVPSTSKFLA